MTDDRAWNSTLRRRSAKRAAELAENGPKPRKPLGRGEGKGLQRTAGPKAKRKGKSVEQATYEKTHTTCELCDMLDQLAPPEWEAFKARNPATLRGPLHVHHVYGRRKGNDPWGLIRAVEGAHLFCHEQPALGRLACLLAKGDDAIRAAAKVITPHPLFVVVRALEAGQFSGRCEAEAKALYERLRA